MKLTVASGIRSLSANVERPLWVEVCENSSLFRFQGSSDHYPTRNNRLQRVLEGRFFESAFRFEFSHSLGRKQSITLAVAGRLRSERLLPARLVRNAGPVGTDPAVAG